MATNQSLADGVLPSTKTAIYTVKNTVATINSFTVFNTQAAQITVHVFVRRFGSSSRQIAIAVLEEDESAHVICGGDVLHLSTGDVVEASATTATSADFVITGSIVA
jgi:hypothetical protein